MDDVIIIIAAILFVIGVTGTLYCLIQEAIELKKDFDNEGDL